MRALLIAAVLSLGAPVTASAATVPITGPAWAQRAVDQMRAPVPPSQQVILAPCPGYGDISAGCNFDTPGSPIYVDPSSSFGLVGPMRQVLYRELGGRFATLAMYPWALQRFDRLLRRHVRAMTIGAAAWVGTVEMFEDAYSDCAQGLKARHESLQRPDDAWVDTAGYDPTGRVHARVCQLISRVGVRAGYVTPR